MISFYPYKHFYAFITSKSFDLTFKELPFDCQDNDVDCIIVFDALKDIAKQYIYKHKMLHRPTKHTPVVSAEDQAYEVHSFAGWALHSSIKVMKNKMKRAMKNDDQISDLDKQNLSILETMRQLRRRDVTDEEEKGRFFFLTII